MYNTTRFDNRSPGKTFVRQDRRSDNRTGQRSYSDQHEPQATVQVFTFRERTVKTHSVRQAHEQAAMAFRTLTGQDNKRQVFPRGQWTKEDEEITLTLEQFSQKVDSILLNLKYNY